MICSVLHLVPEVCDSNQRAGISHLKKKQANTFTALTKSQTKGKVSVSSEKTSDRYVHYKYIISAFYLQI